MLIKFFANVIISFFFYGKLCRCYTYVIEYTGCPLILNLYLFFQQVSPTLNACKFISKVIIINRIIIRNKIRKYHFVEISISTLKRKLFTGQYLIGLRTCYTMSNKLPLKFD